MKDLYKVVEQLVWVGQLGFSLLFPVVACLGVCWWLNTRWGVGLWVFGPGLVLGLLISASTFASVVRYWFRQQDAEREKDRRSGYNKH